MRTSIQMLTRDLLPAIGKNNEVATNPTHSFRFDKLYFTPIEVTFRRISVLDTFYDLNFVSRESVLGRTSVDGWLSSDINACIRTTGSQRRNTTGKNRGTC
jgi:hypothetical protein